MTWYEYNCAYTHHIKKQYEALGHTRQLCYTIIKMQSTDFKMDVTEYMPLATDRKIEKVTEEVTQEKLEEIIKQHQQIFKKHG